MDSRETKRGAEIKAYIVESKRRIEPFGDHPGDCLIVNKPLKEHQREVLKALKVDLIAVTDESKVKDHEEHLIFGDHLYFSPEVLKEFVSRSRRAGGKTVAALKPGLGTLRTVVKTQDVAILPERVEYDLRYVPAGQPQGKSQPIVIDPGHLRDGIPFPSHLFGSSSYDVPLTDKLITQIDHWTNLWSASVATLLAEGARLKNGPKLRLLSLALKARSTNQWKVLRQINKFGHGCDIHPTAYIEGCTIGNNVKIGAMAVVRESVVGDGAYIANNAAVELSVIGDHCALQGGSVVQYSVLYPGVLTTTHFINASMCGRDSFVAAGAVPTDFRMDGNSVTVMKDGTKVDTGNSFLGACLGHGVYVGSGCVVAPGRAVPNGLRIMLSDERLLRGFNSGSAIEGFRIIRSQNANEATH
jgi:acetyltransferase-like isoleucine patch superfamily enzyme